MPRVAKLLPVPKRFRDAGIHRYGFHGLSFSSLMEDLLKRPERPWPRGPIILAHLGGGASLAAVHRGKSSTLPWGFPDGRTRHGDSLGRSHPGLLIYLFDRNNGTPTN